VGAEIENWADLGERVWGENSKWKMQNAKLRNADPEASSGWDGGFDWGLGSVGRGADWGLGWIGFELGLFFWGVGRGKSS